MNLIVKPNGYSQMLPAHLEPIINNQIIKKSEIKEEQTLMSMCFKQFIKERLYGDFINYTKKKNPKKANFTRFHLNMSNQTRTLKNQTIKNYCHENIEKSSNKNRYQQQNHLPEESSNPLNKIRNDHIQKLRNITQLQQSVLTIKKGDRKQLAFSQKKRNLSALSTYGKQKIVESNQFEENDHKVSFISAIQEKSPRALENNAAIKVIQALPAIKNLKSKADNIKKSPRDLFKREMIVVNKDIWELFCTPLLKNTISKRKNSATYQNTSKASLLSKSIDSKSSRANLNAHTFIQNLITNDKSPLKFGVSKNILCKDTFNYYMANENLCIPSLISAVLNYFQINIKIYDEMKLDKYKDILDLMIRANKRVWGVLLFRYLDIDRNGIITMADLFAIYKMLDDIEQKYKEKGVAGSEFSQGSLGKMVKCLRKQIEQMREMAIQNRISKNSRATQQQIEITYLQEAILKKKQVNYMDLSLILGESMFLEERIREKLIIDIDKKVSIKFSSCYRYSFPATDHNEDTRINREEIEYLKQTLKIEKKSNAQKQNEIILENQKIEGISYIQFINNSLCLSIKRLILEYFGFVFEEIKKQTE